MSDLRELYDCCKNKWLASAHCYIWIRYSSCLYCPLISSHFLRQPPKKFETYFYINWFLLVLSCRVRHIGMVLSLSAGAEGSLWWESKCALVGLEEPHDPAPALKAVAAPPVFSWCLTSSSSWNMQTPKDVLNEKEIDRTIKIFKFWLW